MASSGTLCTIARSLNWGHPCGFLGLSLALGFSLTPQYLLLIKSSLLLLHSVSNTTLNSPNPLSLFPIQPTQPTPSSSHRSIPPTPPTPSLPRRSFRLPFPRETHASLYGSLLLSSLSGAVNCKLVILYFTANNHL